MNPWWNNGKVSEPRVSVFCRCGAQWHGRFAVDSSSIREHQQRCGDPVTREQFKRMGYRFVFPQTWTLAEKFPK